MTAGDRRHARRARFSGIVLVRAEDFDINCVGGDVSESGMLLFPTRPPPVLPTRMRVTFALPGSSHWLQADAELVRQKRMARRTAWAIRFTLVDEQTREILRSYIRGSPLSREADAGLPPQEHGELQPEPRSSPGEPVPGAVSSPSGSVEVSQLPGAPIEERSGTLDPDTLMLSAGEVDQLAAASLVADEELPPPPPPDADDDDELDTDVLDLDEDEEEPETDPAGGPPRGG